MGVTASAPNLRRRLAEFERGIPWQLSPLRNSRSAPSTVPCRKTRAGSRRQCSGFGEILLESRMAAAIGHPLFRRSSAAAACPGPTDRPRIDCLMIRSRRAFVDGFRHRPAGCGDELIEFLAEFGVEQFVHLEHGRSGGTTVSASAPRHGSQNLRHRVSHCPLLRHTAGC